MPTGVYIRSPEVLEKMRKAASGKPAWNRGMKCPPEVKKKISIAKTGKKQIRTEIGKKSFSQKTKGANNYLWKGEKVSYLALHSWVSRWKGKPSKCEVCGTETAKKYEWANIDHKYRRVLEDYLRMCTRCHRNYDKDNAKRTKF